MNLEVDLFFSEASLISEALNLLFVEETDIDSLFVDEAEFDSITVDDTDSDSTLVDETDINSMFVDDTEIDSIPVDLPQLKWASAYGLRVKGVVDLEAPVKIDTPTGPLMPPNWIEESHNTWIRILAWRVPSVKLLYPDYFEVQVLSHTERSFPLTWKAF